MTPDKPKIFHITHVDNLASIARDGLICDRVIMERGGPDHAIGMSSIKRRRIEEIEVVCHPGTRVGDFVPFFFCPRSVMLFVIYKANHPDLDYRGGESPIVHLEVDLGEAVEWAEQNEVPWAFSLSNAGAYFVEFRSRLADLGELNWDAIAATDFRPREISEGKQAEFLIYGSVPFGLVRRIGVRSHQWAARVRTELAGSKHLPAIEARPEWYF